MNTETSSTRVRSNIANPLPSIVSVTTSSKKLAKRARQLARKAMAAPAFQEATSLAPVETTPPSTSKLPENPSVAAAPSAQSSPCQGCVFSSVHQAPRATMAGKPVLFRENTRTIITFDSYAFEEKHLCDGLIFNTGDACVYNCSYCYVEGVMRKIDQPLVKAFNDARLAEGETEKLGFQDVVIRRQNVIDVLKSQLFDKKGRPRFADPNDRRVIYSSTTVDVAPNLELLKETAEVCNLILQHTNWQIRLLSKSNILHLLVKNLLIPSKYHDRLILGFSTGTLDDRVAKAIEGGTALVSKRLEALHWLQDRGHRTFGMVCPSLPQSDYSKFSREICDAIRVDRCEHVWAEVINLRGASLIKTLLCLNNAGLHEEAALLKGVCQNTAAWEEYARATFLAHAQHIPLEKYRFLQYIGEGTEDWWAPQVKSGALLLGKVAERHGLLPQIEPSAIQPGLCATNRG
jgi:DNA repair photolyase